MPSIAVDDCCKFHLSLSKMFQYFPYEQDPLLSVLIIPHVTTLRPTNAPFQNVLQTMLHLHINLQHYCDHILWSFYSYHVRFWSVHFCVLLTPLWVHSWLNYIITVVDAWTIHGHLRHSQTSLFFEGPCHVKMGLIPANKGLLHRFDWERYCSHKCMKDHLNATKVSRLKLQQGLDDFLKIIWMW